MSPIAWVAFMVAAGSGATSRYLLSSSMHARVGHDRPWGTFVVNVLGCLAAGVVAGLVLHHDLGEVTNRVVAVGFLGSFTTFSTFTYETVRLFQEGEGSVAALNAAGTLLAGVLAAAAGLAVVGALL